MENKEIQKRQTAFHVSIDEIKNSEYIKSAGEWDPNYLLIRSEKVSRVNIIGVVISVQNDDSGFRGFSFDDGTSSISVRVFDSSAPVPNIEVGDIVLVIGKPREYNDERYIVPDIIRKTTEEWLEHRKKELSVNNTQQISNTQLTKEVQPSTESKNEKIEPQSEIKTTTPSTNKEESQNPDIDEEQIEEDTPQSDGDIVFNTIRELDTGDGADIEEVIKKCGEDAELIIKSLLNEGEIFEIRPGMVKILE